MSNVITFLDSQFDGRKRRFRDLARIDGYITAIGELGVLSGSAAAAAFGGLNARNRCGAD